MELLLPIFLALPFAGFLVSLLFSQKNEKGIFLSMAIPAGLQTLFGIAYTIMWVLSGTDSINVKEITLYDSEHYKFFIDLFFDEVTATYLLMSSILTFMIAMYSRGYMHKDEGYKRYFNTMLLYFFGIQIIIFSGNFETLFIGWEVLGVSSFLLIAYYRRRYLPVRNGFKVFATYRLADVGILMAMWLLHHLFHENITFEQMRDHTFVSEHINENYWLAVAVCAFIILAAFVKSAQFPYSSWVPRAMEGPTPSSSIFYGSIAVHIGIYLLLRTHQFWDDIPLMRIVLGVSGLVSGAIASSIAKVQFSIKAQIAYSSIAQIGIMLVEIALGFETLALIHLTGNAFLRSYQLLISPSIVTYMLRDQFFNYVPSLRKPLFGWQEKFRNTMYILALKEFYMDNYTYKYLWFPFKRYGHKFAFLNSRKGLAIAMIGFSVAVYLLNVGGYESMQYHEFLPEVFALFGLMFVLRAFTIRKHVYEAWMLLILNHFWIALAVSFNEHFSYSESAYYLIGVIQAGVLGIVILYLLSKKEKFNLDDYYGHAHEHKTLAFLFLVSCLALMGFPITTTFLGEDLMLSHIHIDQPILMATIMLNLMLGGISIMRIYARVFLGPNHKWYRSEARRSA